MISGLQHRHAAGEAADTMTEACRQVKSRKILRPLARGAKSARKRPLEARRNIS
jgi:hypothetical protein